jgi:hypothetical protein
MAAFLFRINGGEVQGVSVAAGTYASNADPLLDFVDGPATPDGEGLSTPKIFISPSTVRNATAPEIANFAVARDFDFNVTNKQTAEGLVDVQIVFRKTFKALALVLLDEINILRTLHSLPDRTLSQAVTAIKGKISNEDVT